jgi:S-adenosylmethionine hydrolase
MRRVITLTTDFGSNDAYVAGMKGVILSINPEAVIVDISHSVGPQDILHGAFILSTVNDYFPQDTIHIIVVDPGVGGDREALLVKTPCAYYVAPDNGVLSYALQEYLPDIVGHGNPGIQKRHSLPLAAPAEAWFLSNPRYWRHPVSSTFHGRDIFAPVAAHLSTGVPESDFGEQVGSVVAYPVIQPYVDVTGTVIGVVLHIDVFGNIITNIKQKDLPGDNLVIEIGRQYIEGINRYYAEKSGLIALIGSSNYLEVAAKDGSAASTIGIAVGDTIKIRSK